jgi:CHAP domain
VRRAVSQLGYRDTGHFCNRFGPCEVWCSLFATWAWQQAGIGIGRLPFTGSIYDWAALNTYVLRHEATPQPGDAALFGTGPASVHSSLHVGIVEDVYPGYIVTVEGDAAHRVLRFVVPVKHPKRVGEAGPIYAYASPLPGAGTSRSHARASAASLSGARLRAAIAGQDSAGGLTPTDLRLRTTIRSLRAFQHMPYRAPGLTIGWFGVNALGQVLVAVKSTGSPASARSEWQSFLLRYGDAGRAYAVSYYPSG